MLPIAQVSNFGFEATVPKALQLLLPAFKQHVKFDDDLLQLLGIPFGGSGEAKRIPGSRFSSHTAPRRPGWMSSSVTDLFIAVRNVGDLWKSLPGPST